MWRYILRNEFYNMLKSSERRVVKVLICDRLVTIYLYVRTFFLLLDLIGANSTQERRQPLERVGKGLGID